MSDRRLKKELGQHFLTRSEVCAPLVDFLRPRGELIAEIGPGAGALTTALLEAGGRVIGWELDPRWAAHVRSHFAGRDLQVVVGDALALPWRRLPAGCLVAGNLPYNISTRLVLEMLESTIDGPADDPMGSPRRLDRAGFLVQYEVARRLVAGPGSKEYGSLSVLVALLADIQQLGTVPPGAFRPPPRVDSAFVGMTTRAASIQAGDYHRLKRLVRASFAQRRKTLRNSLASEFGTERADALLESAGLERTCRAEALSYGDFLELAGHWEVLEE